jgi:hypothetical protein
MGAENIERLVRNASLYVTGKKENITGSTDYIDWAIPVELFLQGIRVMVKGGEWGDTIDVEVGYYAPSWTVVKKFGDVVPMRDDSGWQEYVYLNDAVSRLPNTLTIKVKYNQTDTGTTKKMVVHFICHK